MRRRTPHGAIKYTFELRERSVELSLLASLRPSVERRFLAKSDIVCTRKEVFTPNEIRPPTTSSVKLLRADGDGNHIHNEILLRMSRKESDILFPKLEFVRLKTHHVLHEPGDTLKSAYFCNTGLISVLAVFPDGKSVEVGLVGIEGFVGLPLVAGFRTTPTRSVVQIECTAFRVDGEVLSRILRQCPGLEMQLHQFSQISALQTTQLAACNRLHQVTERLARWLLMSADRIGSNSLLLTQEFLGNMLGTRRSSVTVAAGTLQNAGLIAYTRGDVKIIDRLKLEEAACDCYQIMRRQIKSWQEDIK